MFIVTKQRLRASIRETPEGRVYYPTNRGGYVLDAATERNLARALTGSFFLLIGLVPFGAQIGSATHLRALVMVGTLLVYLANHYATIAYVLRRAPRSSVPFSREDAMQRVASTYGIERILLMAGFGLLMVPMSVFTYRDDALWEQAAMLAASLAISVYFLVFAIRVLRAKAAMGQATGARDHL